MAALAPDFSPEISAFSGYSAAVSYGRLVAQQKFLGGWPAEVVAAAAVASDDAMARHHNREGIGGAGRPHGPDGFRAATGLGHLPVTATLPEPDLAQRLLHPTAEGSVRQLQAVRHLELRPLTGEVFVQLLPDGIGRPRTADSTGATLPRELRQHGVKTFLIERDANQDVLPQS